jgi:hypothetical protein
MACSQILQGPSNELALNIYVPQDKGVPGSDWHAPPVSVEEMLSTMTNAEPRLITLAKLAGPTPAIAIRQYVPIDEDDWVLPSEMGAILGDGAHPAPVGSIQGCAMAMEDAAVLGKLFSHLRRAEQIPRLLNAYATLRAERSAAVTAGEEGNYRYMTLPEPEASGRDAIYRELRSKGMNVFGGLGGDDEDIASSLWIAIFTVWIYGTLNFRLHMSGTHAALQMRRMKQTIGGSSGALSVNETTVVFALVSSTSELPSRAYPPLLLPLRCTDRSAWAYPPLLLPLRCTDRSAWAFRSMIRAYAIQ